MSFKIYEIKGYIQTIYLIEEKAGLLLLDGCCRSDVEIVKLFIENELKYSLSDLKLVVSTHAHPDHAGGVQRFKEMGIPVAGPELLNYWYAGVSGFFTYWIDILLTYLVAINKKRGLRYILFPRKVSLDYILKDNDKLPGFENWQVLECPGHTTMDLTLYHTHENLAYVADNFVSSKKNVFRPYPIIDPKAYKNSLQRYIDLGIEDFLIAHYGRVKVTKDRIQELIDSTPLLPRRHLNTLPAIFLKLIKSFWRKLTS